MLPAIAPATIATKPSKVFQAVVKCSSLRPPFSAVVRSNIGGQDDKAGGGASSGVPDVNVLEPVGAAGVRRENPEGLQGAVTVHGASTFCPLLGGDVTENSVIESSADYLGRIVSCGDGPA
jgi:hypothetical protein